MKKILVVTGSRGEWGYLRPILALWKENDAISFDILATNMHLLASHGNTYREIENDGFTIKYKINMAMASDDYYSHSKGLSLLMQSLSDIFLNERYDLVLLSGDRGEQLAAAMCASCNTGWTINHDRTECICTSHLQKSINFADCELVGCIIL